MAVKEIMTKNVYTVLSKTSAEECAKLMIEQKYQAAVIQTATITSDI